MESKKKLSPEEIISQCLIPPRTVAGLASVEAVRRAFAPPVTLSGAQGKEDRLAMDSAFSDAGGYDALYESLAEHAADMGQFPITSFVGYGVLQQIAQQGMVRACIQTVADDMARRWIELSGADDVTALENAIHETRLQEVFHEAFATCGYMGGALIFIDTGADDLDIPLVVSDISAELKQGTPLHFTLIDPVNVSPAEYNVTDPLAADYMVPRYWWVLGRRVHHSRLLRIAENEPPLLLRPNYNFLGIPQAQILWDYVCHFNECRAATAKLLTKISLLVVKTDMDALLSDPNGVLNFDAKMQVLKRYRDNDSIFACDKESEDVSNVQTTVAGCTDIVRQSVEMIAAINRTPAVKLLGISPSGFNATGESDIRNYYDMIAAKQESHREAIMTCIKALELVTLGKIDPAIEFSFVPLDEENSASKAMTAQTKVGAWGQLLDRQVINADEVRQAVRQDPDVGLEFIPEDAPEPEGGEGEGGGFFGAEGNEAESGGAEGNGEALGNAPTG